VVTVAASGLIADCIEIFPDSISDIGTRVISGDAIKRH